MAAPGEGVPLEVVLSAPRGFCAGVVRAVEIVELCLQRFGAPVYVRHEIVHNSHVVRALRGKGAVFVDEVSDVPEGATVIFAAHGVAPSVWDEARGRHLRIIDATCPLVTKVHLEAIRYAREGYAILLVGHRGHDEVVGTLGEAPGQTIVVESAQEAARVPVPDPSRVVALTQTTLSVDDTRQIIGVLKARFPRLVTRNDICYATTNRQNAVKALPGQVDLVLVIGARNSSNCNRLKETAEAAGLPAYLVSGPEELQPAWFQGVRRVGITSGASTPEELVEAVVASLRPLGVRTVAVAEEQVSFVLPKELRREARPKASPAMGHPAAP
ncbi:MAG: 4-hydroxy-3-methylbut-2-enyl diphosphate reductase [Chloroflexi bacterium]|nr:4-hydroxy-3-methylbut-2-enyl diphosphate reductase [Chloroflexota bacterium]